MILITGATGGLGYEIAKYYAAQKHTLLLIGRDQERLKNIQFELKDLYGINIEVKNIDLSLESDVAKLIKYIEHNNFIIEKIINNAGFGLHDKVLNMNIQDQLDMINVNITSLVKLTDYGLKKFEDIKILNVSSLASLVPGTNFAVYSASKSFVTSYSKAVNSELKNKNKLVSTALLGGVRTNFNQRANIESSFMDKYFSMDADICATKMINEFEAGASFIVPGVGNKISLIGLKLLPSALTMKIFKRILGEV